MKLSILAILLAACVQVSPHQEIGPAAACSYVEDELPDPVCTPGDTDPRVTQSNINMTICTRGYTARIRAERTDFAAFKREAMRRYGSPGRTQDYELDHLIPLELGGSNSDLNLWPEPGGSPNAKDAIENELRQRVCAGDMTLADAQEKIRTDWRKALD